MNKVHPFSRFLHSIRDYLKKEGKENELSLAADEISASVTIQDPPAIHAIECAFSYSVMLSDYTEEEKEVVIMGNFMIKNIGSIPVHLPVLCIRITPAESGKLGGKIVIHEHLSEGASQEQWLFVHKDWKQRIRDTGEYWLKPKHCEKLIPGEALIFSNFELLFSRPETKQPVVVEGFVYFQELQHGVSSLNTISLHF